MKASWDDLNARAQGLSTRLLGRSAIEALATAGELDELARRLDRAGFGPLQLPCTPALLEGAVRRAAAALLGILARWSGDRARVLAVVFEDEDRRSLRALLRGAASGAPVEERLSGLVPTPALPPRALEELARIAGIAELAATLRAWSNPYAAALETPEPSPRPDLLQLEAALGRLFAERARAGARGGDEALSAFVEEIVDVDNALSAVVLAPQPAEQKPEKWFVPGGRTLPEEAFVEAARAPDRAEAVRRLGGTFARTPLAEAFAAPPAALERNLLAARARLHAEAARRRPLTSEPLLAFVLRQRAEVVDLQSVIWAVALGAPPGALRLTSPR